MQNSMYRSVQVRRVARGSAAAFVIHAAGIGMTYCSQLLIARMIGVENFGVYAYVVAWMVVLAYISALGFDVALLRLVPAYEAKHEWHLLRGVIKYAQRGAIAVSAVVILIGISVIAVRGSMSSELRNAFLVGFMLVPVWALLWIRCSVVRGLGGVVWALLPDRPVRDGMVVGIVALASLGLSLHIDAPQIMMATLVSSFAGLALVTRAMHRFYPRAAGDVVPVYEAGTWRRIALPLVIITATEALMNRTGVLILGWLGHTRDAGIYGLAFNIAFVVALPRIAVNTLLAPAISSFFTQKDQAMLQVLVASAASWILGGAACIALLLAVMAEPLLTWFGPGFGDGVWTLRILLLGQVFASAAGSQLYVMTMTGHERSAAALLIMSAGANAIASAALVSLLGVAGAAIATAATLIIWNLAMALFLWRRLQLLPGVLAMFRSSVGKRGVHNRREDTLPRFG